MDTFGVGPCQMLPSTQTKQNLGHFRRGEWTGRISRANNGIYKTQGMQTVDTATSQTSIVEKESRYKYGSWWKALRLITL